MSTANLLLSVAFLFLLGINDVTSFNVHTPTRLSQHFLRLRPRPRPLLKKIDSPNALATRTRTVTSRDATSMSLHATPLDLLVTMYTDSLMDFPVVTNMATGGLLAFLGDAIAQIQDNFQDNGYDKIRAASLVLFILVYRATQSVLFPLIMDVCDGSHLAVPLSMLISDANLGLHALATMEQTFASQFVLIPFIYYPIFFSLTGFIQGLSIRDIMIRAQNTLIPLLKRNWLFWIPVQYFQFGYIEKTLQIPFLCVAGLAWTFILSAVAGSAKTTQEG